MSRVVGFLLVPAFSVITPLVALPAITARFGAGGWSSVALGLAVGAIASTVIELGWGWNGPARVARASESALPRLWASSLLTRVSVALLMTPLGAVVSFTIAPAHPATAALTAAGTSLIGLSPSWLFIGRGRPWAMIAFEMAPRAIGAVAATLLLVSGSPLAVYALVAVIAPVVVTQLITLRAVHVDRGALRGISFRRTLHAIRGQFAVMTARVASTAYMQLPIVIVSAISPISVAATYSAGDRLMRMTLTGLAPVPSMSQRWVNTPEPPAERWRRAKRAIWGNLALGVLAGLVFALAAPFATTLIFSGVINLTLTGSILMGMTIVVVCTSRATGGLGLVVQKGDKALLRSAIAGAVSGVVLIPILTSHFGVEGAFMAVFASELLVLVAQLAFLRVSAARG